jgi:hypothetical protein
VHRDADLADFDTLSHTHAVDAADLLSEPFAHEHAASIADVDASIAFRDGDAHAYLGTHDDPDANSHRHPDADGSFTVSDAHDVRDDDAIGDAFSHSFLYADADPFTFVHADSDIHIHIHVHLHPHPHVPLAERNAHVLRRVLLHAHGHADVHADTHADDHAHSDASLQDPGLESRWISGALGEQGWKRGRHRKLPGNIHRAREQ